MKLFYLLTCDMLFYMKTTPRNRPLPYCNIKQLTTDLMTSAGVTQRQDSIKAFNQVIYLRKSFILFLKNFLLFNASQSTNHNLGDVHFVRGGWRVNKYNKK